MSFLSAINPFNRATNKVTKVDSYQVVVDSGNSYYAWNGNVYQSDIVRAAIRPKAQAVGKAVAKHIRDDGDKGLTVNPDPYMRFLLEEPNELMTMQMLLEKLVTQLELNGNAYALITRDGNQLANGLYPLSCTQVNMLQDNNGKLYLECFLINGKKYIFNYSDIIHLRKDFHSNDYFGESVAHSLAPLMEIVTTTDQGIVKAIKNSNVIKWLIKYNQVLRPEDVEKNTKEFVKTYLSTESETIGAAGIDSKAEAKQVEPKDYVPNEKQMELTKDRIYSLLNTNEKIVQSKYNEDEWISYYESQIEPIIMQLSGQLTNKLFSRRERGFGNKIMFESSSLSFASMKTKLELVKLVDRAVISINEMRAYLNLPPVPGGDERIMRKDTGVIRERSDD